MLLETLRDRALRGADPLPSGYQEQPIRYIIRIGTDGSFRDIVDTADVATKSRGMPHAAPHVKRASGIKPKLLADTAEYALGIARNDPKKPTNPARVARQHEAFINLVDACMHTTDEPSVRAVATFLREPFPQAELPPDFDPSATLTFRVADPDRIEGILPIALPSVQAFWANYQAPEKNADGAGDMSCIICGAVGPVLERHPLKIKGIPGGQILKDLISANAPAFESYGLSASKTAPTCPTCAEAYGNALNALLADKSTSLWTKELAYAFWTDAEEEEFGPIVIGLISEPQAHPGEVHELLTAHWSGKRQATSLDPTRFHAAAFGASGARVVVKDWIDTTVGDAKARLARYFALQELIQWDGSDSTPLPMMWIANSTVHRKASPPPIVPQSLIRLALGGDPLPLDLLFQAVRRNRAEQGVRRERAMLIKMVLGSQSHMNEEEIARMSQLDETATSPAYICGRLLAVLDRIQYLALGQTNATIVDKFYGTASSAPASVFGTLVHGAQNHLSKLRRDKPGAHRNIEVQMEDVLAPLASFPRTLTLEEQGLFALGFYHQRAADRARAAEGKAKREGKPTDTMNLGLDAIDDNAI